MTVFRVGIVALVSVVGMTPCSFGQGRIARALEQGPKAATAVKATVLAPIPGLQAGPASALTGAAGTRVVSALVGNAPGGIGAGLVGHKNIVAAFDADKAALGRTRPQRLQMIPGLAGGASRLKAPVTKALKAPAPPIDPDRVKKKAGK